ncbi:dipeptide ABC transporter ATP-binding protein [Aureimonas glaciei]|uniref:Oligopeptide ABC transporter ATP-binding protein OppF n=1 Tax=Aureimonas glaciei TaxID=1776957 RepID=A0A917DAB1_9HYPH|nr:ABC transporter ATP-binding protein [Aureimonas glaciei]GGD21728.1 oligopeptide ABC transporter ATP-binding protein OppF [Aureimonas glaciei]
MALTAERRRAPAAGTSQALLTIEGLNVAFRSGDDLVPVLRDVDLTVGRGEIVCLVGESGSGKSLTALSIAGLLPDSAVTPSGRIDLGERRLVDGIRHDFKNMRGKRIGMIFQEPMTSLNPVLRVSEQIAESLVRHRGLDWRQAGAEAVALLEHVGIADAERRAQQYIHQLSGGMRQRVMIASAIAAEPELLIADEPTTALDVTVQAQVLDLIRKLRDERGMGVLFITHDLGVVADIADRVYVMYGGRVVEAGSVRDVLKRPRMPYTRGLLRALPHEEGRVAELYAIPGTVPSPRDMPAGCGFAPRCEHAEDVCRLALPVLEPVAAGHAVRCARWRDLSSEVVSPVLLPPAQDRAAPALLLQVRNLVKHFSVGSGFGGGGTVRAVDGVSFSVGKGEVLALVGESGSGKTTLGRCLLRLIEPTSGEVSLDGVDLVGLGDREMMAMRRRMQIVFQDPFASLNPKMTVGAILSEPLKLHRLVPSAQVAARVTELLGQVGLPPEAAQRRPSAFSGGQRQRIAIARALALEPDLIVADEAVSALDVSVRAQVTSLLQELRRRLQLSMVFITHDLALVRQVADRVVILYLGKVMEEGNVEEVYHHPRHPYTRALLSAVPRPDPDADRQRIMLEGDIPSPIDPPSGCVFRTRCPRATAECAAIVPPTIAFGPSHSVACLHPL